MIKIVAQAGARDGSFTWKGITSTTDFELAKAYLRRSILAKTMIENIERHPTLCVNLLITTDPEVEPNYFPYLMTRTFNLTPPGNLITWNPQGSMRVRAVEKGKKTIMGQQSPAMGLLHELGHSLQHYNKRAWFVDNYQKALNGDDAAKLAIENDNIEMYELPVAMELGEGVRYAYRDVGTTEYKVYTYPA